MSWKKKRFGVTQQKDSQTKLCSTLTVPYSLLWDNILRWKALLSFTNPERDCVRPWCKKRSQLKWSLWARWRLFQSIMTQHAAALQTYNNELVKCKTSFSSDCESFWSRCGSDWVGPHSKCRFFWNSKHYFIFLAPTVNSSTFSLFFLLSPSACLAALPTSTLCLSNLSSHLKKKTSLLEHWYDNSLLPPKIFVGAIPGF